jgi:hypothetical protein
MSMMEVIPPLRGAAAVVLVARPRLPRAHLVVEECSLLLVTVTGMR